MQRFENSNGPKENAMTQQISDVQSHAGAFATIAEADRAIRRLLAAGFSKDQLVVICPAKFQDHFRPEVSQAEAPAAGAEGAMVKGGIVGATLGGLAMAATVLTGGGAAVAAAVLIGGGAVAGGFSNLIISKGYEGEADDQYKKAIEQGRIVVGVEVPGPGSSGQLAEAERILNEAGAKALKPA
jgi:hypothetical protein